MTSTIDLNELTLRDRLLAGETGFYFTDLIDWYSLSASKSPINQRPQATGGFGVSRDWRESLVFTIKGGFWGASHVDALVARDVLMEAVATGEPVTVRVTDDNGPFSRTVSVRSLVIDDDHGRKTFTFTMDMEAPDPLRYGAVVSLTTDVPVSGGGLLFPLGTTLTAFWDFGMDGASGRVLASNPGTAPTYSDLSVTGGLELGFIATDRSTGEDVRFDRPIPVGSTVTINQRTGRATIDGQSDVSGFLTRRNFFSVPPGETHQIQFAPLGAITGTPQLTVSTAPAYW